MERTPAEHLQSFIDRYAPPVRATARHALATTRKLLPGAVELVYDSYNNLAVTFGPTERVADAILSITLYPRWVSLFFTHGATLPDPHRLLKGSGTRIRHIVLDGATVLDRPAVRALIAQAVQAGAPIDATRRGQIVIKSISAKQRPRLPA